jgi:hypothetical protein
MAQKLTASLPPDLNLPANFIIQISAVDPSTGAVVSGVKASNVAIIAEPMTPDTSDSSLEPVGPFLLVPGPAA